MSDQTGYLSRAHFYFMPLVDNIIATRVRYQNSGAPASWGMSKGTHGGASVSFARGV